MNSQSALVNAILSGDKNAAQKHFDTAIREKVSVALDIKRIQVSGEIYNKAK